MSKFRPGAPHLRLSVGRLCIRCCSHAHAARQSSRRLRRVTYSSVSTVAVVTSGPQVAPTTAHVLHTGCSARLCVTKPQI